MVSPNLTALSSDKLELEKFLSQAERPQVKLLLEAQIKKLEKEIIISSEKESVKQNLPVDLSSVTVTKESNSNKPSESPSPAPVPTAASVVQSGPFQEIRQYEMKKGTGYSDPMVVLDFRLKFVETIPKENITVEFTSKSIDLKVIGLPESTDSSAKKQNWRFRHMALQHDIVPNESSFTVKKNHVIVEMQKTKKETATSSSFGGGYEFWTELGGRRRNADNKKGGSGASDKNNGNPSGSSASNGASDIMSMMRDLYDEGDQETKALIGKAMESAYRGGGGKDGKDKKDPYNDGLGLPEPPMMDDMDDDFGEGLFGGSRNKNKKKTAKKENKLSDTNSNKTNCESELKGIKETSETVEDPKATVTTTKPEDSSEANKIEYQSKQSKPKSKKKKERLLKSDSEESDDDDADESKLTANGEPLKDKFQPGLRSSESASGGGTVSKGGAVSDFVQTEKPKWSEIEKQYQEKVESGTTTMKSPGKHRKIDG